MLTNSPRDMEVCFLQPVTLVNPQSGHRAAGVESCRGESHHNPGGQHVARAPLPTFARDTRTYGPHNVGHLHLTAKAAPSRGGGCSPDTIHSSGDRLGLHEPRSHRGIHVFIVSMSQGRAARDRAIGLAVTRFNSAPAERQGWMTSAPFKTASKCPRTGKSRGGVEGHAGRGAGGANSLHCAGACQRKHVRIKLIAGLETSPRDFLTSFRVTGNTKQKDPQTQ